MTTTLLIFMFETGDRSCPYWTVPVIVHGPYVPGTLETKAGILMDDNPDLDYAEITESVLNAAVGVRWEWIDGKIPACDRLDILIV